MKTGAGRKLGHWVAALVMAAWPLVGAAQPLPGAAGGVAVDTLVPLPDLLAPLPQPDPVERDFPVVLELYTAQGCVSCPPADEMLAELAMREDIIALSLHVDYWDYIGWADVFADPEHAERQKRYARRHGLSTIYTPQVVIGGTDILEGFRVMRIMDLLAAHALRPGTVALDLARAETGALEIRAEMLDAGAAIASRAAGGLATMAMPEPAPLVLQLVRYRPMAEIEILAGENAGRHAQYFNIVTSWRDIGHWDGHAPLQMSVQLDGDEPAVVILQEAGQGQIVAAARLR